MKLIVIAMLLTTSTTMAVAAEPSAPSLREKCGDDIKKLCAAVPQGEGRIIQCLVQNTDKLSQGCRNSLDAMRRPLERPNSISPNSARPN